MEGEYEGEEFFRRIASVAGRFARQAAPALRQVARVAAPIVGTAVAGPVGGMLARTAANALLESEIEGEVEYEGEYEDEARPGGAARPVAEMMAAAAARVPSEAEAEAYAAAAAVQSLSPQDLRDLHALLPHLVHGTAILTRLLRRRAITRPAVRVVPTVIQRTARTIRRYQTAGRPVTPRTAGRIMATQVRGILGSPRTVTRAMTRNVAATRRVARPARRALSARRRARPGLPARPGRRPPTVVVRTPSGRVVPGRAIGVRVATPSGRPRLVPARVVAARRPGVR
jgi:hypothetical protein